MNQDMILLIAKKAIVTTAMVSAPILLSALFVGLIVAMFQAMTQINESTLSFIPKLIVVGLIIILAGNWMLNSLMNYTVSLFNAIPQLIGG